MATIKAQSAGGQATALKNRADAIVRYMLKPSRCRQCGQVIPVGDSECVSDVRKKKYCDLSCAAHANRNLGTHLRRDRRARACATCGASITDLRWDARYCVPCSAARHARILAKTKDECRPGEIGGHARTVLAKVPKRCALCGYDRHAEVCHIKPVGTFLPSATLGEINRRENLVYLCPNCHWCLDHNLLTDEERAQLA